MADCSKDALPRNRAPCDLRDTFFMRDIGIGVARGLYAMGFGIGLVGLIRAEDMLQRGQSWVGLGDGVLEGVALLPNWDCKQS